jgi:hypothetical protein
MRPWESALPPRRVAGTDSHGRMDHQKLSLPHVINAPLTARARTNVRSAPNRTDLPNRPLICCRGRSCRIAPAVCCCPDSCRLELRLFLPAGAAAVSAGAERGSPGPRIIFRLQTGAGIPNCNPSYRGRCGHPPADQAPNPRPAPDAPAQLDHAMSAGHSDERPSGPPSDPEASQPEHSRWEPERTTCRQPTPGAAARKTRSPAVIALRMKLVSSSELERLPPDEGKMLRSEAVPSHRELLSELASSAVSSRTSATRSSSRTRSTTRSALSPGQPAKLAHSRNLPATSS